MLFWSCCFWSLLYCSIFALWWPYNFCGRIRMSLSQPILILPVEIIPNHFHVRCCCLLFLYFFSCSLLSLHDINWVITVKYLCAHMCVVHAFIICIFIPCIFRVFTKKMAFYVPAADGNFHHFQLCVLCCTHQGEPNNLFCLFALQNISHIFVIYFVLSLSFGVCVCVLRWCMMSPFHHFIHFYHSH